MGKTQSNMSMPSAQQITRSVANPTPIKYLGRFSGKMSVHKWTTFQKSSLLSPPLVIRKSFFSTLILWKNIQHHFKTNKTDLKPPTANPLTSLFRWSLALMILKSEYKVPCTMGKRACESGFLCAFMQRSSHLVVLEKHTLLPNSGNCIYYLQFLDKSFQVPFICKPVNVFIKQSAIMYMYISLFNTVSFDILSIIIR